MASPSLFDPALEWMVASPVVGADPDRTSLAMRRAALAGVAAAPIFGRLSRFAQSRGLAAADAEDVVQIAMTKFLTGNWDWDPERHPDVGAFLMGIVRSETGDRWKGVRRRSERPRGLLEDASAAATSAPDPGDARVSDERVEVAFARLRERLANDPTAKGLVDLVELGVDARPQQAARLRVPIGEIYDAHDRIQRHVRRIARELAEESRSEEVAP